MNASWSRFNIASIVLGFAFLYLPIVLLVIFSFNDSQAGHRLGRLLDQMVRLAVPQPGR